MGRSKKYKRRSNKNNGIFLLIIAVLLVIAVSIIAFGLNNLDKEAKEISKENNQSTENNENIDKEKDQVISYDDSFVYGFAYVYKDYDNYKLMALNSNGDDIELNSGNGGVTFYLKNNKLLFINRRANSDNIPYTVKTYYIDLNSHPYNVVKLTEGVNIDDYFDFNETYLFAKNISGDIKKGIKRYDFNSKNEVIFEEGIFANGIFISNNKVYYSTMDYSVSVPQEYYYAISFDGTNKEMITKEIYDQVVFNSGYKEEINTYNEAYLIKNNNRVYVDNMKNLVVGDKVVYTATDEYKSLILSYSSDDNIVSFREVILNSGEAGKYYDYYIDTGEIKEVTEQDNYLYRQISIK